MKKIAQFIAMTVTSAITILSLGILLFRIDLIVDLLNSKPILIMIGLTIGATVGFLVGVLTTYHKFNTELTNKNVEIKKLKKDLSKAAKLLEKALPVQAQKSAEDAKNDCDKRAQQVFSEISDLSENGTSLNFEEDDIDE